jgi:hypothetical protein
MERCRLSKKPVKPVKTLASDIEEGRRLSGALFPASRHCSRQGDSPLDLWDFENSKPCYGWHYVGWCPSGATAIPKSNWGKDYPIAVLLENETGGEVWVHTPATPELISLAFSAWGMRTTIRNTLTWLVGTSVPGSQHIVQELRTHLPPAEDA